MSFIDHTQSFQVPYNTENTYDALKKACTNIEGFEISNCNDISKTIYIKAGVSLFSWGENITVVVNNSQNGSEVSILSTPKTGVMFGGALDMGKNRKNITAISDALSIELQNYVQISTFSKKSNDSLVADEIEKLANLKEQGIISQEEFDTKKKQLLGL